MTATLVLLPLLSLLAPQAGSATGGATATVPSASTPGERRVVGVDPRTGWPIFAPVAPPTERTEPTERPAPPAARPVATTTPDAESPPPERPRADLRPLSLGLDSPLLDVFARVGRPADLDDLVGAVTTWRLRLLDADGAVAVERDVVHEVDLRTPDRDRLVLPGQKTYCRDGADDVSAWLHGLRVSAYEGEAADELAVFGLIQRAPWCFGDPTRWRLVRTRAASRAGHGVRELTFESALGAPPPILDAATLVCDATTHEPLELEYRCRATGRWTRLLWGARMRAGAVRLPTAWRVVDAAGSDRIVFEQQSVAVGREFAAARFRGDS